MSLQNTLAKKAEIIIIKIGTDALCKEDGMPDIGLLRDLVAETAELKQQGHTIVWITSGAVGVGKALAKKRNIDLERLAEFEMKPVEGENEKERRERLKILIKQVAAGIGQPHLMRIYDVLFYRKHKITRSQLLTEKAHFSANKNGNGDSDAEILDLSKVNPDLINYLNATLFFPEFIVIGNENDAAAIRELKLSDNDELAALVAVLLKADRVIYLSKAPGVCKSSKDVREDTVESFIDFAEEISIDTSGKSASGTGGMGNKMKYAKALTALGIYVHIASSREKDVIRRIVKGDKVGTKLVYGNMVQRSNKRISNQNIPKTFAA